MSLGLISRPVFSATIRICFCRVDGTSPLDCHLETVDGARPMALAVALTPLNFMITYSAGESSKVSPFVGRSRYGVKKMQSI